MKDQYAGDLHDYRKLGILRILAKFHKKIGVVWMMTKNDKKSDGKHTDYLLDNNSPTYEDFDKKLYDKLRKEFVKDGHFIAKDERSVKQLEKILTELNKDKFVFFEKLDNLKNTNDENIDLLFFDPDNGIKESGKSEKHLSWNEIEKYADKDLLIFHFLGRNKKHAEQIDDKVSEIKTKLHNKQVLPIKGDKDKIVFFYITNSTEEHLDKIKKEITKRHFNIPNTNQNVIQTLANAEEVIKYFKDKKAKDDSPNVEMEGSIFDLTDKDISPETIEQILKGIHRFNLYFRNNSLYKSARDSYLEKRKELLDKAFEFTPENIEKLLRVNQILTENCQKVLAKAKKMYDQLQSQNDDFIHDFEIFGTVNVSYNGDESLIDFDPEKDESCGKSKYPHIAEIIDSAIRCNSFDNLYECHFNDNATPDISNEEEIFWEHSIRAIPPIEGVCYCWAFHNLVDHTFYALQDIIRINDFWNEVKVWYQNFDGDKSW